MAAGEKPYILKHDSGECPYYLVLVPVSDAEIAEWAGRFKTPPRAVAMGPLKLMPLSLEPDAGPGSLEKRLYDAEAGGWTATVAVMRFK